MSDVLTADEVGALLRAFVQLGERDKADIQPGSPRVRSYDFLCPSKVSREGLKHLKQIHTSFGSTFSSALADYLKVPSYSRFAGSSQIPYREFWASQADNSVLCEVSCKPIADRIVIQMSPSIADACLDILMGGTGAGGSNDSELTAVDCVMLSRVLDVMLQDYRKSWSRFADVETALVSCQTARAFSHSMAQNESVVVFNYEVRVSSTIGTVSICVLADTTTKMPEQPCIKENTISLADIAGMGVLGESVRETKVECKAILGRVGISIADVTNLRTGDILTLDSPADSEVEFWVGEKLAYAGSVGRRGNKVGVKINRTL